MNAKCLLLVALSCLVTSTSLAQDKPLVVDKEKKTLTIACTVAPRKLPKYKEIYPLEVVATYPDPKGRKAHETVVCFTDIKPSDVHKALEQLGLKPGKPAKLEGTVAQGPEVRVLLELPGADGKPQRVPIEKTMVDRKTGKPMPALKWHFTGSVMKELDPEKDEKTYAADASGTLICIFPVTDETVIQTNLKLKDQELLRLETNKDLLPKEGTAVKLIIEASK